MTKIHVISLTGKLVALCVRMIIKTLKLGLDEIIAEIVLREDRSWERSKQKVCYF